MVRSVDAAAADEAGGARSGQIAGSAEAGFGFAGPVTYASDGNALPPTAARSGLA